MCDKVEVHLDDRWTLLDFACLGIDCRDRLPAPKTKPVYRVHVLRGGPCDPRAAEAVLEWLNTAE